VNQAAEKLFISPKTVENHRSNIMRKLGIHKTIDLVRYAARLGLIDIDLWKE
jgi:DNA-binding NarL/FixJ family response regulator